MLKGCDLPGAAFATGRLQRCTKEIGMAGFGGNQNRILKSPSRFAKGARKSVIFVLAQKCG
jgi:hypothetical protein